MVGFLQVVIALLRAAVRDRGALVAENLLLRQQLAVLTLWDAFIRSPESPEIG